MSRPASGYYNKAGVRVPSVTEVIGKCKSPDALVGWGFRKGYASGMAAAKGLPAPKSAFEEKNQAAQAGTIAHDMLEAHVNGTVYQYEGPRLPPGVMERAVRGFENGKLWFADSRLQVISTERSLVSELHGFGGTYDAKFRRADSKKSRLGDYKTSSDIYADYLVQVAAYGILVEECEGDEIEGYDVLRFSKPEADWEHHYYTDLSEARQAFLLMLKLYPIMSRLEDRV